MARSRFNNITSDLVNDGGTVLVSLVQGEQLELPVVVDFIIDPTQYSYEAVAVEADNVEGQTSPPTSYKKDGSKVTLNVRIPAYKGVWSETAPYSLGDLVSYGNSVYEFTAYLVFNVDATPPSSSSLWEISSRGKLFIQIPKTVSDSYQEALVGSPVYGFLELRVTEKVGDFPKTFKPIRGVLEFLFSPTHVTPDI